jgi:Holliday junction resolvasome RuvABC endonuclease subunit
MKEQYDFSKGERGKFYRKNAKLNLPIYLDDDVLQFVEGVAKKKKMNIQTVVNRLLKNDIEIAELLQ